MFMNKRCCGNMEPMHHDGHHMMMGDGCCERQQPIMEPTTTNCVEREFYHEVQHCCPMHTHVINKHIYNHTYTPQFTCSEENVVVNNDCGKCPGQMF